MYHSYNSNNGSLKKSTYGNGQSVEYLYDGYGRLSGEKVTNTSGGTAVQTSAYVYDALGRLSREKDYVNGHTSIYQYDIAGRLTRQINGQGSFLYSYDNLNRPDRMSFTFDGQSYLTTYDYLSANRPNRTDLVVGKVSRTYDNLQREIKHQVYSNDSGTTYLETSTSFIGVTGNRTTQLPQIYTTFRTDGVNEPTRPGGYTGFTYAYDNNGNITTITETNGSTSRNRTYTYDSLNRLKTDVDPVTGKTTTYTYDARGNILSKNVNGQTVTYTYGDSTWKDLLTAYNGTSITYDAIGNPLSYRGNTFTWQRGRQLASATTANGQTVTYRYNTDGIRIGKTVNGVNTEYLVDTAGAIHAMKQGNHTLIFMYDSTGRREGFVCYSDTYGDAAYYYLYNAQGDVIGLTDGSLNTVVQYTYDAWGKSTGITGSKAGTIGKLNPFRYRGYVYDEETELYYLQSRYYDPEVGRFLNADGYVSTGQGINGFNMFVYCGDNPTRYVDYSGKRYCEATTIIGESAGVREQACAFQRDASMNTKPVVREPEQEQEKQEEITLISSLVDNLEVSFGLGMGFYGGFDLFDTGGSMTIGMNGNNGVWNWKDGEFSYGQDVTHSCYISIGPFNIGYDNYVYMENGKEIVNETKYGVFDDGSLQFFNVSGYLFGGGFFTVGFDLIQFLNDVDEMRY